MSAWCIVAYCLVAVVLFVAVIRFDRDLFVYAFNDDPFGTSVAVSGILFLKGNR